MDRLPLLVRYRVVWEEIVAVFANVAVVFVTACILTRLIHPMNFNPGAVRG